jgi:hypothetical protein
MPSTTNAAGTSFATLETAYPTSSFSRIQSTVLSTTTLPNGEQSTIYSIVGTLTPYVPLTTIFTPPASCSVRDFSYDPIGDRVCWDQDLINTATLTCYPSRFAEAHSGKTAAYFSPGVCPRYYTTIRTSENDIKETLATCCPS